jgi:hypothetical protein
MNPEQVLAVSNYWVAVCVYSQALYSSERSIPAMSADFFIRRPTARDRALASALTLTSAAERRGGTA